jgi:XXXCH domain-containing protein
MSRKKKIEFGMSKEELVTFLRAIADCVEHDLESLPGYDIDLSGYKKFRVSFKRYVDSMVVKCKIRYNGTEEEYEEDTEYQYEILKKRMKTYFKELQESVNAGSLPSREIISVFLKDAEAMTSFHGYGEENEYLAFMKTCTQLKEAYDNEDMQTVEQMIHALEEYKDQCHDKYK